MIKILKKVKIISRFDKNSGNYYPDFITKVYSNLIALPLIIKVMATPCPTSAEAIFLGRTTIDALIADVEQQTLKE